MCTQDLHLQEQTLKLASRAAITQWQMCVGGDIPQRASPSEGTIPKAVSSNSIGTEQPVQTHPFTGSLLLHTPHPCSLNAFQDYLPNNLLVLESLPLDLF